MSNPKNPEPAVGQVYEDKKTGQVFSLLEVREIGQSGSFACSTGPMSGVMLPEPKRYYYLGTLDELRAWAEQRQNKPGGFRDEDGVWHSYEDADEKGGGE